MIQQFIYKQDVIVCIIIILITIFALWLFFGGRNYDFVGLEPLQVNKRILPYFTEAHPLSYSEMNYDLWTDPDYSTEVFSSVMDPEEIDTTPHLPPDFQSMQGYEEVKTRRFESKGEAKCREVIEFIYGKSFPNKRPQFLRNPETGRLMELDCYNDELKLAVEYNGIQHYVFPNYTNQSYDEFIQQCRRDQLKVNLCDLHGIYLITVPYNVKLDQIYDYITYYLPENVRKRRIQELEDEFSSGSENMFEEE
jgi:hypothetical protein